MKSLVKFKSYRHCPRCGHRLSWRQDAAGEPKRQVCGHCGYRVFHNPVTAVEAYLFAGSKILALRRARDPRKGFWDFPGGFIEAGENPLRALRREVREELRGYVLQPRLFGAYASAYFFQNEWTSVIVLAYVAHYRGPVKLNRENSEYAWVSPLAVQRLAFVHQRRAIRDLRTNHRS